MSTDSLNCPNCGAPLINAGRATTVVCDHCGSVVALKQAAAPPATPDSVATYGSVPAQRPAASGLASLTLGPADASQVIQLLRENQEQAAIQLYQAKAGVSLDDAIDAVRAIRDGLRDAAAPSAPMSTLAANPADLPDVRRQLEMGDKIGAIKAYRYATGKSLAEAKADVENLQRQSYLAPAGAAPRLTPPASSRPCGCAVVPLAIVALCICIFGGCSAFVQNQVAYRCALSQAATAISSGEYLSPPIHTSALVLVTAMHNGTTDSGDFVGATILTPVWGSNGFGLLYMVFNSTDNLTYNDAGANLLLPGKFVSLLPFRYSRTFGYETDFRYACQK